MKTAIILLLTVLFCVFNPLWLYGQQKIPAPNWDRTLALQTIRTTPTQATLKSLFQMARAGKNEALLESLHAIDRDAGTPAPAKDYLVLSFTLGLSDLDANAVGPEVLAFLSNYQPVTLVAHDDHPAMVVPLFNVRAAAAGLRNHWDRQQASSRASNLLAGPSDQLLWAYLAARPAERRGFEDALEYGPSGQLSKLGWSALTLLEGNPELTLLTARAGMNSGDFELLKQSIALGGGPDLHRILAAASRELSADEGVQLLHHSLHLGSDSKAALAIAQLAPARLDDSAVRETLFETLADQTLGASAALVLGASADPEIQARLNELASNKDSLAGQRAALAVSTRQADRGAER